MRKTSKATGKVLILYFNVGGGHKAVAEALVQKLLLKHRSYEIKSIDILSLSNNPINKLDKLYSTTMNNARYAWKLMFKITNNSIGCLILNSLANLAFSNSIEKVLVEEKPNVVVSSYPFFGNIISDLAIKCGYKSATVVTDLYSIHKIWFSGKQDLLLLPSDNAKELASNLGINNDKCFVLGLPLKHGFIAVNKKRKLILRNKYNLDKNKTTALIIGGGEGSGKIEEITEEFSKRNSDVQLVIVCGKNTVLKDKLLLKKWNIKVVINGFVANLDEWMKLSDVVITKGGPTTISEAIAVGLPIIIYDYYPGQEKGNVDYILENKLGYYIKDHKKIVDMVDVLSRDNDNVDLIKNRMREVGNPDSAAKSAQAIVDLIE